MALFGGQSVFGRVLFMRTIQLPRALQINTYCGLNGLESIDCGSRGRSTHVRGLLIGHSLVELLAAEVLFADLMDGVARTLVDSNNATWENVLLRTFSVQGRILTSPEGFYLRLYEARFLHLI